MPRPSLSGRAGLALATGLYLALTAVSFDQVEEDAFLYYRAAENLAAGEGYRFDRGGERIETGSSPLWQAALAGLAALPVDLVIAGKLLGVAVGALCLGATYALARALIAGPGLGLAMLPVWLLAASPPFVLGAQRGLEAPLELLAFLLVALCAVVRRAPRFLGAAAALMLLARPEGVFIAPAFLAFVQLLLRDRRDVRSGRHWLVLGAAAALLFGARLAYFHDIFPAPFYAKLGFGAMQTFVPLGPWAWHSFFALPLLALAAGLLRREGRRPEIAVLCGGAALAALWHVVANDYMPHVRHLLPAIALGPVAALAAVAPLASRARWGRAAAAAGFALYGALAFGVAPAYAAHGRLGPSPLRQALAGLAAHPAEHAAMLADLFRSARPPLTPYREQLAIASLPPKILVSRPIRRITTDAIGANYQSLVGDFLAGRYPDGTTVVYDQMGQTPYYAGPRFAFVDTAGLADRTLGLQLYRSLSARSRSALSESYLAVRDALLGALFGETPLDPARFDAVAYVLDREPDVVLSNAISGVPGSLIHAITNAPRFRTAYALRYRLNGLILVYERRGELEGRRLDAPADLPVEDVRRCLTLPARPKLFPMLRGVPPCPAPDRETPTEPLPHPSPAPQ